MYEALERHAADFNDLQKLLADPTAQQRVWDLRNALKETAQKVGDAQGGNDFDRANRAKIYRGLLAASRLVEQLSEREMAARP